MPPSPRGSLPAIVVGKHADGRLGSAPQVLGRRDLEDRAADPESLTGSAPPLDVALSFRTSPAGCLRAFKRREPIDNVNKKYYEERTLEKHFRRLECKSMDCKFNTCNDESYVPSLERLQSESRAAAERRCLEMPRGDPKIGIPPKLHIREHHQDIERSQNERIFYRRCYTSRDRCQTSLIQSFVFHVLLLTQIVSGWPNWPEWQSCAHA